MSREKLPSKLKHLSKRYAYELEGKIDLSKPILIQEMLSSPPKTSKNSSKFAQTRVTTAKITASFP